MTILIFILVLVALIVVHEFGHFVVAKLSGMRVDDFGIGYPPRAWSKKIGETEYSLNWLPFGGFVKIYGEDAEVAPAQNTDSFGAGEQGLLGDADETHRAFGSRPRILQALVLVAGIAMNIFFAYVLLTITLMVGTPRALDDADLARAHDIQVFVADTVPSAPGALAGIAPGDSIKTASYGDTSVTVTSAEALTAYIAKDTTLAPITLTLDRNGETKEVTITPKAGVVVSDPERPAIGVALATAGVLPVSFTEAVVEGALLTKEVTVQTAVGLAHFFAGVFTFTANLAEVSGPVGIAGAVGNASSHGIIALLSLTAIISINLALINVLPFPALDGGRLLFVIIEAIIRRPIPPVFGRVVNNLGFAVLILLMVVVTAHDLWKLF